MKLTPQEIETPLWKKIEAEIIRQIELNRAKNDKNLPPDETAIVRGTIAALKTFKDWGQQTPNIT